ncbi:relaxase/mobilization nuclease domain-containing protein [Enterocloster clostridioformis]
MNCRKEIRLSSEELEELNRKAKERGLSDSQYLRMLITNRPRDYPELLEALQNLTNEINHIGININQIVKNNNSGLYHESDKKRLYVSGHNCLPETALKQMLNTKRRYDKMGGRQGYHIIISFEEAADTVDKDVAMKIIGKFVEEYLGKEFEAVYALHDDTDHIHGHIAFNSVRCIGEGKKYDYRNGDWDKTIQPLVNKICEEYHMATLDLDKVCQNRKKKRERIWDQGKDGKFSWNDMIRRDIDQVVAEAENWDEFLIGVEERGYEIKQGAHILLKPPGMDKGRRLDTLGGDYTEEKLRERISIPISAREKELPEPILELPPRVKKVTGYIPRRKSPLTGYQKLYFTKLYRLGVLKNSLIPMPENIKKIFGNFMRYRRNIISFRLIRYIQTRTWKILEKHWLNRQNCLGRRNSTKKRTAKPIQRYLNFGKSFRN